MASITPDVAVIEVVGGVDTHLDTHTAAVIDTVGRVLGTEQFPATVAGYGAALAWMRGFGRLSRVGVEGTGAYGAGLNRRLHGEGVEVIEVDRPSRKTRRRQGKSDPIDAVQAAKTALAGERSGVPKQRDGRVEAVRMVRVARRSAVEQRADIQRQIKALIVTAPEDLRTQLRGLSVSRLITTCAGLRPGRADGTDAADPATVTTTAAKITLRSLARRHQHLTTEISSLDDVLAPLVTAINPGLLTVNGVGIDTAGQLLVTAGENHHRITSEAAFAMLCGVAPIPASSGKTVRYRLNRGGDRQANAALYRVTLSRLRWDPRTRAYMQRRTTDGLTKKEIIRCLKRYIARELYQHITNPQPTT
jgi:transposase